MTDKSQTTDFRQCGECGTEWEAPMGSQFVCPRCGLASTLLGTHPLPRTTDGAAPTLSQSDRLAGVRIMRELERLAPWAALKVLEVATMKTLDREALDHEASRPFAETVAARWKRDPEFRAAMVEDSHVPAPSIASLRRLYHHMVHGGRVTHEDEIRTGIEPLTRSALARRIENMERAENAE